MTGRMLNFRNQQFYHDLEQQTLHFHIKEPFYSAGKKFGWIGATVGLGISEYALDYAERNNLKIQVTVAASRSAYRTTAKKWRDFSLLHGATMQRGGTPLIIIRWADPQFETVPLSVIDEKLRKLTG